jgi:hypothetical protein
MDLWAAWLKCVWQLRAACSRHRTFLWMVIAMASMSIRSDLAGVTSFVRSHWLREEAYLRLLNLFHSPAVKLDRLTQLWARLAVRLFDRFLVRVNGRIVLLADGIKTPKEGRKMPGVKLLHQESENNSKAEFIMGHSCQAVALLVKGIGLHFAVPIACRIHEGIVFSNRCKRTLLDRLVQLIRSLGLEGFYVVADAYYASQKIARPLLESGDHLITRLRSNAVGYRPAKPPAIRRRGRPRKYGPKVKLRNLFRQTKDTVEAVSSVYSDDSVRIRYRCADLLWRPVGRLVRVVAIRHPTRGNILLMSTDLTLDPLTILQLYSLRFKIELSFKQGVHTVGTYAYRFWMLNMKKIKRRSGNQYLHHETEEYRKAVRRKMAAYHCYIQVGVIVQGLLQYLALSKHRLVWQRFHVGSWMRTMHTLQTPSELVVAHALRNSLAEFLLNLSPTHCLQKILGRYLDLEKCPGFKIAS